MVIPQMDLKFSFEDSFFLSCDLILLRQISIYMSTCGMKYKESKSILKH